MDQLEKWVKESFSISRPLCYSNEYKGPYTDRKLGKVAFVHFATEDEAREVAKTAKDRGTDWTADGRKLKVAPAKTEFFKQRDWALRKAEDLLKKEKSNSKQSSSLLSIRCGSLIN